MTDQSRDRAARALWLVMALVALSNTGCLVVAAGAAAGGAAVATVAYARGSLYREYSATKEASFIAVRDALADLHMPILRDEPGKEGQGYLEARTSDGQPVRIYFNTRMNSIPVDGLVTRISVRVGSFGDEAISTRILDQVNQHLTPLVPVPAKTTQAAAPPAGPRETAPPPLAK